MRQYAGCQRFVWNRALSIEQARYRRGEKRLLGKFEMMRQLTMWRNNPDPHSNFLKDAPVHHCNAACTNCRTVISGSSEASKFTRRSLRKSPGQA